MLIEVMNLPKISAELAEETGWHMGDGTMNFYKNRIKPKGSYALRGHRLDDRKHYEIRIKPLYKEIYGLDVNLRDMPSTGCFGFQKWSNEIVNFKHKFLGLPLGKKLNIQIPNVFRGRYTRELLRGIYDTDGCLYLENKNHKLYPRVILFNTSFKLIFQMDKLIKKLKLKSTINTTKRKETNWNDLHRIEIRGEKMLKRWFKIVKPQNPKHIQKYHSYLDRS